MAEAEATGKHTPIDGALAVLIAEHRRAGWVRTAVVTVVLGGGGFAGVASLKPVTQSELREQVAKTVDEQVRTSVRAALDNADADLKSLKPRVTRVETRLDSHEAESQRVDARVERSLEIINTKLDQLMQRRR